MIQFRKSDYILTIEKIGKSFSFSDDTVAPWRIICKKVTPLLFILLFLLPLPSLANNTLSVDRDTVIQDNFLGINAVYHAFTYLPESIEMGMNDKLRAIELARVKTSGIRIARTFYRPDWAMRDGPWLEADWHSTMMQGLYAWLKDMQKINVDVALNMGWWFPRDVIWNRDQQLPSFPDDLQKYCQWVSDSLHQMIEVRGFTNIKYIVMFTEPADRQGDPPPGKELWDYYKRTLRAVNQRLLDDNRRALVKVVGPNTSRAPLWLDQAAAELDDVIDIYASHNYNFTTYNEWYEMALAIKNAVAKTGKPFWIDEYGIQDFSLRRSGQYGTALAQANAAFLNAGAQASFLWIFNDQYYPAPLKYHSNRDSFLDGKHSWGLFPWLPESQAVRPAGQAFTLLSRLMGQAGTQVLQTKGLADLPIAAVGQKDGVLTMLVINEGKESKAIEISLSRPLDRPLYRYAYGPTENPPVRADQTPMPNENAGKLFRDTIDAGEVVIYTTHRPEPDATKIPTDKNYGENCFLQPIPETWQTSKEPFENLALQKKVVASTFEPAWPATNLTDGKRLTSWRSAGKKNAQPEQVIVDLGQNFDVQRMEIFPGYGGVDQECAISNKSIEVTISVDNKKWRKITLLGNRPSNEAALTATFPPQAARYIRITSKRPQQSKRDRLFRTWLGEIKVYGR
ncbi:MAG: discoidin domain-containing protein [Desulfobulbaceae bacterium]|nr:discoidin domain-containing protein [Desulfobulbaceae bacterium]